MAASVEDREGARLLLSHLLDGGKKLRQIGVDGGYQGHLVDGIAARFKFCLTVVLRPTQTNKLVRLLRRWVIERTFAWLNPSRRSATATNGSPAPKKLGFISP
jgi:putative transposase